MEEPKSINLQALNRKQCILVGGEKKYIQFEDAVSTSKDNTIISPPCELPIEYSISSYSIGPFSSVIISKEGEIYGTGVNFKYEIELLQKITKNYLKTELKYKDEFHLFPISALCLRSSTIFLVSKQPHSKDTMLICIYIECKILDIGTRKPVALYGHDGDAAAIDTEGAIIYLPESVLKQSSRIKAYYLPDNEKAVSVAFGNFKCVISLSSSGKVFMSRNFNDELFFYPIKELNGIKITSIAGAGSNMFAVSEEGRIYGYTFDSSFSCLDKDNIEITNRFVLIDSLSKYKITAAYAGYWHSLFQTSDGKILACGRNNKGQLMLSDTKKLFRNDIVETVIKSGAVFCVTGDVFSAVFINCDAPNSPNRKISIEKTMDLHASETKIICENSRKNCIPSNKCIIFSGIYNFELFDKDFFKWAEFKVIDSPRRLHIDETNISSFSVYSDKLIIITKEGEAFGMGDNTKSQISGSLPEEKITSFMKIELFDKYDNLLFPISASCCCGWSLYLASKWENKSETLLLCSSEYNRCQRPTILNIKNRKPVALFKGYISAVIDSEGAIILLFDENIEFLDKEVNVYFLPNNEKAIRVAFSTYHHIIALSANGRVFISSCDDVNFIPVRELDQIRIKSISGVGYRCYAISEDGSIYGCGKYIHFTNESIKPTFVLIESLKDYNIVEAYVDTSHSLFQTTEGQVIGYGENNFMNLMLETDEIRYFYDYPIETIVKKGAKFCIVDRDSSFIFINCDAPRSPNRAIQIDISAILNENSHLKKENEFLKEKIKLLESEKIKPTNFNSSLLDNLKQVDTIGHNSKSRVYKVSLEQFYAIKLFIFKNQNGLISQEDRTKLQKLFKDYETINAKGHRNIVKMFGYDFGDENHSPWILLEFCQWNLDDVINEMTNIQRVCSIVELCQAMKEVHSNGLIHRNLKPENVLFDQSGHVKLSDIGNCHIIEVKEQTQHHFMSPELLSGKLNYNEKVDVYSFGVIVFYILTRGKYPDIGLIDKINGKILPIPDMINAVSKKLILNCLSFDAKDRPSFSDIIDFIKHNNYNLIDGNENKTQEIIDFIY